MCVCVSHQFQRCAQNTWIETKMTPVAVYLLQSVPRPRRTYVGCSSRGVAHRVCQHNGELSGGAKQTSTGRPWTLRATVTGFRTRQEGLQFEYAWRRVHRRCRHPYSLRGRLAALTALMNMTRWSRNAPLASEVPLVVTRVEEGEASEGPPQSTEASHADASFGTLAAASVSQRATRRRRVASAAAAPQSRSRREPRRPS